MNFEPLEIVIAPAEVLSTPTIPVEENVLPDLVELGERMLLTMQQANGIGLAAPQVGVSKRVLVMKVLEPLIMFNPEITDRRLSTATIEGCLSLPGMGREILRSHWVKVCYRDTEWVERTQEMVGLSSICVQHEIDHLDGVLMTDRPTLADTLLAQMANPQIGVRATHELVAELRRNFVKGN